MRLLIYADLQATDGSERCFSQPDLPLQRFRVQKFFEVLHDVYEKHRCDGLVDLGDTTDDRSAIPMPAITDVLNGLSLFPPDHEHFKIIGNHEQFLRDASLDSAPMYASYCAVIRRETRVIGSTAVTFASYPDSHDKLAEWLAEEARKHARHKRILFGHFQVVGASMNSGKSLTGIPVSVLKQFDVCLLGHVHLPQTISESIHYVGSPFEQNWGEAGQAKRVAIIDTNTLHITWIPMVGFPRYRQVPLNSLTVDDASEDRLKVVINNRDEAQRFYATPHAAKHEAVHAYTAVEDAAAPVDAPIVTQTPDDALQAWLDSSDVDVETRAALLDVGRVLIGQRV